MKKDAFTLVEIMVVVAIIGILATIAIPSFIKASENAKKSGCISNLKQIESAIARWALETNAASDTVPETSDLVAQYIKTWPKCMGVDYITCAVSATPACPNNLPGHVIQADGENGNNE